MHSLACPGNNAAWPQGAGRLEVAGVELAADPSGVLFHPDGSVLIVADLHLEKGSAFAARGQFLPPYDTAATLMRLALAVARYQPRTVIALGDSFHDGRAGDRMAEGDCARLAALQRGRDWLWIAGNHDPAPPAGIGGDAVAEMRLGALILRHEPSKNAARGEIAGHLHPVARVVSRSGSLRRRCFAGDGERCILPAFGAFAGGLNILDQAYASMFGKSLSAHVLGRDRIYRVGMGACVGDG